MRRMILLAGPSGSGKSSVATAMERKFGMKQVVSYTTRPPRYEGEQGHLFISDEEFDALEGICAFTVFNGYKYGVTSDIVDSHDIYVIDPYGIEYLKAHYKGDTQFVAVALRCSSEVARQRMLARGDSIASANSRLAHDTKAFANLDDVCDIHIDVDNLTIQETVEAIMERLGGKNDE